VRPAALHRRHGNGFPRAHRRTRQRGAGAPAPGGAGRGGMTPGDSHDDPGLIEAYLAHVRVDKRLAERTVALYTEDMRKLAAFAAEAGVALVQVQPAHVRRWIAQMHGR